MQISFHFDEIFHINISNFQFCFFMLLRRHLVEILGNIWTKITLPLQQVFHPPPGVAAQPAFQPIQPFPNAGQVPPRSTNFVPLQVSIKNSKQYSARGRGGNNARPPHPPPAQPQAHSSRGRGGGRGSKPTQSRPPAPQQESSNKPKPTKGNKKMAANFPQE